MAVWKGAMWRTGSGEGGGGGGGGGRGEGAEMKDEGADGVMAPDGLGGGLGF